MQIFWTDNLNRETVSERLVVKDIVHPREAEAMLKGLKDTCTTDGPNWYRLADDGENPYKFEP